MGILAAAVATFLAVQEPVVGPELPPDLAAVAAPAPSASPASPLLIPASPAPDRRPLVDPPESGPGLGGFLGSSILVVALLGGALWLLRRYGKNSPLLGTGDAIRVLARKPLGQRQEILLVEAGPKVFMVGSTRDGLATLGEFDDPDQVAQLRARMPGRQEDSQRVAFRDSLREGIREEERPAGGPERAYASIADELAEIRKTVKAWKA